MEDKTVFHCYISDVFCYNSVTVGAIVALRSLMSSLKQTGDLATNISLLSTYYCYLVLSLLLFGEFFSTFYDYVVFYTVLTL